MAIVTEIICPLKSMPDNRAYAGWRTSYEGVVSSFEHPINITYDMSPIKRHKIHKLESIKWVCDVTTSSYATSGSYGSSVLDTEMSVYISAGGLTNSMYFSMGSHSLKEPFERLYNESYIYNNEYNVNISVYKYLVNNGTTSSIEFSSSDNEIIFTGEFELFVPLPPTNLSPITPQDPRSSITFAWIFNNASGSPFGQTGSEIEYYERGGEKKIISITSAINQYTFSPNYFTTQEVTFRVRNKAGNEWGEWSDYVKFQLTNTPPFASTLVFPLNVSVSGVNGVLLEWRYNSPFDTFPSRFDVRYRVDDGAWITKTNYSFDNNPAYQSAMTNPITTQSKVEWQVMAFGAVGDAGPWSEIGVFFTIGVPNAPTIVRVSNSNRPTIYFSAINLMAWELEIRQNDIKIYETGNQPFLNEFSHVTNQFFTNGNYLVRMRVTNEYGLTSDWGVLPFTINTVAPQALKLQIVKNPSFNMRLHFNNTSGKTVYIYRSELRKDKYLRIGVTNGSVYDDYTARPRQRYEYFVRVVNPDFSFADSNIETGSLSFLQTTIVEYDNPNDMLKLIHQLDGKPTKDRTHGFEKTLTQFVGRKKPVLQIGEHSTKSLSLSFYCDLATRDRLEELNESDKVLIMRDWRLGVLYGTIDGSLSDSPALDKCVVSFVFTEVDFNEEVELT